MFIKTSTLWLLLCSSYIIKITGDQSNSKEENGQWNSIGQEVVAEIRDELSKITSNLDHNKMFSGDNIDEFLSKIQVIFPGTLWCGPGNISDSSNDLGVLKSTDSCCRDHDMCPDYIEAGKSEHGLVNKGLFTRSHCDCDEKFYNCLKNVNTVVSNGIGFTYFTVLGPQCFKRDYPIVDCLKEDIRGRCLKYEKNETQDQIYEWFDNPDYVQI
ncbi:phospholipase A2-like [Tribolium madens]|uniref:phospholipase A2-like n=1 Tax=Tribolium madens TaxID=41895 RepID=UPI001CF7326E|nr:phospholipase A2-like [Tribolium madens]